MSALAIRPWLSRPFRRPDWSIRSRGGVGEQPQWFPTGDRLAYHDGRNLWEVGISTDGGFRAEERSLFARGPFARVWLWSYDVAPDGRLLVVVGPPEESIGRIEVVTNVFAMLGN